MVHVFQKISVKYILLVYCTFYYTGIYCEADTLSKVLQESCKSSFSESDLSLSDHEKLERISYCIDEPIHNRELLSELSILHDPDPRTNISLLDRIQRPHMTIFGKIGLAQLFNNPITDQRILEQRQQLIHRLVTDDRLFNNLTQLYNDLKKVEDNILYFWGPGDDLAHKYIQNLFWKSKFLKSCNYSWSGLYIKRVLECSSPFWELLKPWGIATLIQCGLSYVVGKAITFTAEYTIYDLNLRQQFNQLAPDVNVWTIGKEMLLYLNPFWACSEAHFSEKMFSNFKYGIAHSSGPYPIGMAQLLHVFYMGVAYSLAITSIYKARVYYKQLQEYNSIEQHCKQQLLGVSTFWKSLAYINDLSSTYSELQCCNSIQADYTNKSDMFISLTKLLETSVFVQNQNNFSSHASIRLAYQLMNATRHEWEDLFMPLGQLEAYLAIATFFRNNNTADQERTCFVNFVSDVNPYISLQGFWNPFLDAEKAVVNDIELGNKNTYRNILLTGSNTGGKSTLLKALGINMLLAHVFGVCFARHASMTPFGLLLSSLRVQDNTSLGESFFYSEIKRAQWINQSLRTEPSYAFLIIDELFVGTDAQVGQETAYEFAKQLAIQYPHALIVFVTHFKNLTELEDELPSLYKNFVMNITKDSNGQLIRTYKISPGKDAENIARDILNEHLHWT